MSNHPILYSFRRCPWAMRARFALYYAGVQCEIREVDLKNKPEEFLKVTPKATVPTLVLPDGTVIDESMDVINYALKVNDPDGWLNIDADKAEKLIKSADGEFAKYSHRYKYIDRFPEDKLEDNRQKCEDILIKEIEELLSDSKFLLGDIPSIADVSVISLIRQFAAIDKVWWESSPYVNTRNWLNNWLDSEIFSATMKKYKPWQKGDDIILFI